MIEELLAAWGLRPREIGPTASGINNLSRTIETAEGRFFLRVYQNTRDPERVRYEHELLAQLDRAGLSFAVPRPVPTADGSTFAVAPDGRLAALFPAIDGEHPRDDDPAQAQACGAALAELDEALSGVAPRSRWNQAAYGDLARIHRAVPEPHEVGSFLGLDEATAADLARVLAELEAEVAELYVRLPRQIIHGDVARGNTLVVGTRVSGIFDFEFAGPDLRAIDLVAGLHSFALGEEFTRGYLSRSRLADEQLEAVPRLRVLREAVALLRWTGRYREGLAEVATPRRIASSVLAMEEWRRREGAAWVARASAAS